VSRPFDVGLPLEQAYLRKALFALEVLDGVTLERVTAGVRIVTEGLVAAPRVNSGGLFVWFKGSEDVAQLRKLTIEPGTLPYEPVALDAAQLNLPPTPRPLTTIELPARADYVFPPGTTAALGTLLEDRSLPRLPVANAEVRLLWLDDDQVTWHAAPVISHTNANGDFVTVLRLSPSDVPHVDSGALTVRLWARRAGGIERRSSDVKLRQGRVADPSTLNALTFAWDELLP